MPDLTPPTPITCIVTDVDGTLLNPDNQLSDRTRDALKAAIAQGVNVILATGKTYHSCRHIVEALGLTMPGVFSQGLQIVGSDGTVQQQQTLDPAIARKVLTFIDQRGFLPVAYAGGRILARTQHPYIDELHAKYHEPKPEYVGPLQNQLGKVAFNKLLAIGTGTPEQVRAFRWQLNALVDGGARLVYASIPHMFEILPPGASKGGAVRALLNKLNIAPAGVMALGDGENDIELLRLAGWPVAMGNADSLLKAEAKFVTGTNAEDGVAMAVEQFVLPKRAEPTQEDAPQPEPVLDTAAVAGAAVPPEDQTTA